MINKIVAKLSTPFKSESSDEFCKDEKRATLIVEEMIENISRYGIVDLESIIQEIKNIVDVKEFGENVDLEIIVDDNYGRIEVSTSILQVILNILNNSLIAFGDDSNRKEIKLQFICNEYGLEIECCDNAKVKNKEQENQKRDTTLYISREIIKKIFHGKIDPSSREYSRSEIHPADNSGKTCFYIALPYSKNCLLKEGYE